MIHIYDWKKEAHGNQPIQWSFFKSSIGYCLAAWVNEGLCSLSLHPLKQHKSEAFEDLQKRFPQAQFQQVKTCALKDNIEKAIASRGESGDLSLILKGTPFQKKVWKALMQVPSSSTTTYKKLTDKVRAGRGYRAVGSAVGANPIAVLIPCHRVLRQNGDLGGFRWGLGAKKALLSEEGYSF